MTGERPAGQRRPLSAGNDDLLHTWCCDPDRAMCGVDLTGVDEADDLCASPECVVCLDLDGWPCEECGARWVPVLSRWRRICRWWSP